MGRPPLLICILSILCVFGGMAATVYFTNYNHQPLAAVASAFQILVGVGLWNQWRWAWWVGMALCLHQLYWNYEHQGQVSEHLWFVSGAATVYFIYIFREYN